MLRTTGVSTAFVLASLGVTRLAAADDGRWYGHLTLGADAAALAICIGGIAGTGSGKEAVPWLLGAGAVYVGASPVIHLLQDRPSASLGSLGLRVGMPLGGALVGYGVGTTLLAPNDGDEVIIGMSFGFLLGLLPPIVLDPALLAWDDAEPEQQAAPNLYFQPHVALAPNQLGLGISGGF